MNMTSAIFLGIAAVLVVLYVLRRRSRLSRETQRPRGARDGPARSLVVLPLSHGEGGVAV